MTINGKQFLKGLKTGDEVAIFDVTGKLLLSEICKSDVMSLDHRGVGIVKIKSDGKFTVLKFLSGNW